MNFKNLVVFLWVILFAGGCSRYDDSLLWKQVNENMVAIAELKTWQAGANNNILTLQSLVAAMQNNDFITGIDYIEGGYVIKFSKSSSITILNGAKGETGARGDTPQVGVEQYPANSGIYYWTIDGNWLLNDNGERIAVSGEKGEKGEAAVTPQLRINETDNCWEISCDNGTTWIYVLDSKGDKVNATGPQGAPGASGEGDAIFAPDGIDIQDDYVEFTLVNGVTKIRVPRVNAFSVSYLNGFDTIPAMGGNDTLVVNCLGIWRTSADAAWVSITPTAGNGNGLVYISVLPNGTVNTRKAAITFSYGDETITIAVVQKSGTSVETGSAYGVLALSSNSMGFVLNSTLSSTLGMPIASPQIAQWVAENKMHLNGCYLFNYEIDYALPGNAPAVVQANGYYVVTIMAFQELAEYDVKSALTDTTTVLPDEVPVLSGFFGTPAYVEGYLLVEQIVNQPSDMQLDWDMSYDNSSLTNPREEDGVRYYDLFVRAVKTTDGTKTPENVSYLNAYRLSSFLQSAAEAEKAALGSSYSDAGSTFSVRFNYAKEIEEGVVTWQNAVQKMPVASFAAQE